MKPLYLFIGVFVLVFGISNPVFGAVLASYTSANSFGFGITTNCDGETFRTPNDGVSYDITGASFYLKYNTAPITGNLISRLYLDSGTFGTNDVPTGSPLVSSEAFDASLLTTGGTVSFTFNTEYLMDPNEEYAIVVCGDSLSGAGAVMGRDNNTNGYAGSAVDGTTGSWTNYTTYDVTFSISGEVPSEEESTTTATTTDMTYKDWLFINSIIIFLLMFIPIGTVWSIFKKS